MSTFFTPFINAVIGLLRAKGFVAFLVKTAISVAASYAINKLLAPKLPKDSIGSNPLVMTRNPIAPRRVIYGQGRYSGPMLFANVSGTDNKYLHIIVALAGHEVAEIGDTFWFDDKQVDVPYPGNNTTHPTYAPHVLLNKHRGESGQTADGQLLTDIPGVWTSAHKLEGIAYLMVRLSYDQQVFPGGIPNITALVRGKKCYDPRDSSTAFSQNPAICLRDYLTNTEYGMRASSDEIDDDSFIAAANICDESVGIATSINTTAEVYDGIRLITVADITGIVPGLAVAGTGIPDGALVESVDAGASTVTITADPTADGTDVVLSFGVAERRYTINGAFETDAQPATVIEYILATMAGSLVYVGGKWRVKAGAYETPTVTLDEDDLRGAITIQTRDSIKDTCNGVKGTFANPVENYQLTDFAGVQNSTYVTEDNGELWRDVTQPFVTSHSQAQRLAKIELEKARRDTTITMQCKLTALKVQAGDTVAVTNARMGWTAKPFLVTNFTFGIDDDLIVGCDLTLRETDATIFDFDYETEEQPYEPSTDPDVPDFPPPVDPDYRDLIPWLPEGTATLECRYRAGLNGIFSGQATASGSGGRSATLDVSSVWNVALSRWDISGVLSVGGPSPCTATARINGADWIFGVTTGNTGDATSSGTGPATITFDCYIWDPFGTGGTSFNMCVPGTGAWSDWTAIAAGSSDCNSACLAKQSTDPESCEFQDAEFRVSADGLNADGNYYVQIDILRRPVGSSDGFGLVGWQSYLTTADGSGSIAFSGDVPQEAGYETCVRLAGIGGTL